ncbi:MAG: hypothetical protein HZA90_01775 [Verrucomicrobia bacterium]|nr:hypothetical protein [Verrucomicrobiota bacterium]
MPITHTNRCGKTYYLHTGPKRGGGTQHYFAIKSTGQLADRIPEGFEVHETVNGGVFLRRQRPKLIRDEELACIRRPLDKPRGKCRYQVEASDKIITVHESSTDWGFLAQFNPFLSRQTLDEVSGQHAQYQPVMRFVLVDVERRLIAPERYCFRGSVDDWISIGSVEPIEKLAAKYLKHLGQESLYELY